MDQIKGIVDMQPLKRTFMPQMENKKRYHEVQRVVSPNIHKVFVLWVEVCGVLIISLIFFEMSPNFPPEARKSVV